MRCLVSTQNGEFLNSRGGCTTTHVGDIAIAIGPGATASASGGFNTAISFGRRASASATGGVGNLAVAAGNPGVNQYSGTGDEPNLDQPTTAQAGTLSVPRSGTFAGGNRNVEEGYCHIDVPRLHFRLDLDGQRPPPRLLLPRQRRALTDYADELLSDFSDDEPEKVDTVALQVDSLVP